MESCKLVGFSRTVSRPFRNPNFELEVSSAVVPCEMDFVFVLRAVGLNGHSSRTEWTPPSCVVTSTTPVPSTTEVATTEASTEPAETTPDMTAQMEEVRMENERLQAKIDGLKQEYEKIGLQVFHAFKESFFKGLEEFLARRKSEEGDTFYETPSNDTQNIFG